MAGIVALVPERWMLPIENLQDPERHLVLRAVEAAEAWQTVKLSLDGYCAKVALQTQNPLVKRFTENAFSTPLSSKKLLGKCRRKMLFGTSQVIWKCYRP